MKYPSVKHILLLHSLAIDRDGGLNGVRDHHAILSSVAQPAQKVFGKELYPTIFLKAAVYARNIIMNHPFVDGNKRTGMLVAIVFLENNSYEFLAKKGEIEKFAVKVVREHLTIEQIATWFKKRSQKI